MLIIKAITKVRQSLRIQLLTTFIFCAFLGLIVARASLPLLGNMNERTTIDYSPGMQQIRYQVQHVVDRAINDNSIEALRQLIEDENVMLEMKQSALKVLVTDESGKVLYKTKQAEEEQINLHNKIGRVMEFAIIQPLNAQTIEQSRQEYITFYPITIEDKNLYLFVSGIPQGVLYTSTTEGDPISYFIVIAVFTLSFFYLTKRKMKQIEALAKGVMEIAKGNLDYRVKKKRHR